MTETEPFDLDQAEADYRANVVECEEIQAQLGSYQTRMSFQEWNVWKRKAQDALRHKRAEGRELKVRIKATKRELGDRHERKEKNDLLERVLDALDDLRALEPRGAGILEEHLPAWILEMSSRRVKR